MSKNFKTNEKLLNSMVHNGSQSNSVSQVKLQASVKRVLNNRSVQKALEQLATE
ncbi:hypothetical protein H9L19_06415 [Weissella diestrammenae]|uniref:Uncharacterized protein n=1 Tax=Weissella diestrammenae TaxID=1162633 RepID=A0A7G9T4J0_9LACO|nr:hypothetical protein [Weissella diestrammenae]MCM0582150.1 hypothetical protein [Weissella diestrammenae]QNN75015.1 hypothetical protein H9L19_06415 [Weissella diestrammenae]